MKHLKKRIQDTHVQFKIRLQPAVLAQFQEVAHENDRSVSGEIASLVKARIAEWEKSREPTTEEKPDVL